MSRPRDDHQLDSSITGFHESAELDGQQDNAEPSFSSPLSLRHDAPTLSTSFAPAREVAPGHNFPLPSSTTFRRNQEDPPSQSLFFNINPLQSDVYPQGQRGVSPQAFHGAAGPSRYPAFRTPSSTQNPASITLSRRTPALPAQNPSTYPAAQSPNAPLLGQSPWAPTPPRTARPLTPPRNAFTWTAPAHIGYPALPPDQYIPPVNSDLDQRSSPFLPPYSRSRSQIQSSNSSSSGVAADISTNTHSVPLWQFNNLAPSSVSRGTGTGTGTSLPSSSQSQSESQFLGGSPHSNWSEAEAAWSAVPNAVISSPNPLPTPRPRTRPTQPRQAQIQSPSNTRQTPTPYFDHRLVNPTPSRGQYGRGRTGGPTRNFRERGVARGGSSGSSGTTPHASGVSRGRGRPHRLSTSEPSGGGSISVGEASSSSGAASAPQAVVERKAYHPKPPSGGSNWVMWVGNVPHDATQEEAADFFNNMNAIADNAGRASPSNLRGARTTLTESQPSTASASTSSTPRRLSSASSSPLSRSLSKPSDKQPDPVEVGIESIFLILQSHCAFVNYISEAHLQHALTHFNGRPFRPGGVKLVCRIRRKAEEIKSGVGGQRGLGLHKKWVEEHVFGPSAERRAAEEASSVPVGAVGATVPGFTGAQTASTLSISLLPPTPMTAFNLEQGALQTTSAAGQSAHYQAALERYSAHLSKPPGTDGEKESGTSSPSTTSTLLATYFPVRYFVLKAMTKSDLQLSAEIGLWATQAHNEFVLDQAYRTSEDVYLIFGANKAGEFHGYARMEGAILEPSETKFSLPPRDNSPGQPPMSAFEIHLRKWDMANSPITSSFPVDYSASEKESEQSPHEVTTPSVLAPPTTRPHLTLSSLSLPASSPGHDSSRDTPVSPVISQPFPYTETPSSAFGPLSSPIPNTSTTMDSPKFSTSPEPLPVVGTPQPKSPWGTAFPVRWIEVRGLPFHSTRMLRNSWNKEREVKVSRDGTELEPSVGQSLLELWEATRTTDNAAGVTHQSHRDSLHRQLPPS